jgi:hypothetical protein
MITTPLRQGVRGNGEQLPIEQLPPGHCASTKHDGDDEGDGGDDEGDGGNGEHCPKEQVPPRHSESNEQLASVLAGSRPKRPDRSVIPAPQPA